jgi:hypothetical protein
MKMINLNDLIWVELKEPDDFLKVKETLTRIGVSSKKDKILYQSVHILHKKGRYALVHFKQLFMLDGKPTNFTEDDQARLNSIASLLSEWNLVTLVDPKQIDAPRAAMNQIKILSFGEKNDWVLESKYSIGKKFNQKV